MLNKKRKLNPKEDLLILNRVIINPIYSNYSIVPNSLNPYIIEELTWNYNYDNENKKLLRNKTFNLNKKFKEITFKINKNINFLKLSNRNESFNKEKDYIYHCLMIKNFNIKQILEINQIRNIPCRKFNLILDIDLTLIKAVEIDNYKPLSGKNDIEIKGRAKNIDFHYYYRYRPYLFNFIKELKDYFNFYISTLSHINYANKILTHFKSKANIIIPERRIAAKNDRNMTTKNNKYINELISLNNREEINNTVILDDNAYSWLKDDFTKDTIQSIKSLILSKRYVMDSSDDDEDNEKYDILIHNNIFEKGYDIKANYLLTVDNSYCIEMDSDVNSKSLQLLYVESFLKKCIKFSLFSGIPMVEAMNYYRKKIFENCKFNLKYLSTNWDYTINLIIKDLGGIITNSIKETTHFVIESKLNLNKIYNNNKFQKFVNINYILQCYFNLIKFNESDKRFNININ